ncbi:MAG: membrane protein insertion efficiency factor YidD [Chloroflexota bacterium]
MSADNAHPADEEPELFQYDWNNRTAPSPAAAAALSVIRGYKRFLSPLMPSACRFVPSCSEYGHEAIGKYGIIRGGRLAVWRILRCNPFGGKGWDPVP